MTIRRWILALLGVFAGWIATLALVMLISDAAPGAIVFLPGADFVESLPVDIAVAGAGSGWIAVRGETAGMGMALYRAGGWFVLPAGMPGCLPLPKAP